MSIPRRSPNWSLEEDRILRQYHPDFAAVERLLPGRTGKAVRGRAYELEIGRGKTRKWTAERKKVLQQLAGNISDRDIAKILGTSQKAIAAQRQRMRLASHGKWPERIQVLPLVQDIRDEAVKRGVSVHKLTKALTLAPLRPSEKIGRTCLATSIALVDIFSGELYAEWED